MNEQVNKIRDEIEKVKLIIQSNKAQGAFSEGYLIGQESVLEHFEKFFDSMQEEPKTSVWLQELQDKLDSLSKEDFEKAMAKYRRYGEEESVSELLNTESMIESYKRRLISQANGVKNSPLIDMCLASYKHGINETLDTLNLFNVLRNGKD